MSPPPNLDIQLIFAVHVTLCQIPCKHGYVTSARESTLWALKARGWTVEAGENGEPRLTPWVEGNSPPPQCVR